MEEFRSPKLTLIPFWFLNHKLSKEEIEFQLDEMLNAGVREFMIHARRGLEVPEYVEEPSEMSDYQIDKYFYSERLSSGTNYLSEEWWEMIGFILSCARERGMKVWIYDEFDWPSGVAGHDLLRKHPEYSCRHLLPVEVPKELSADDLRYAFAVKVDRKSEKLLDCIDLSGEIRDGMVSFSAKEYTILGFRYIKTREYVNLLDESATKKFIQLTHEEYRKRYEDYFDVIQGFFTDETQLRYFYRFSTLPALPWTDKLEKIFQEKYGYDLIQNLPLLIYSGKNSSRVRIDYWSLLSELYIKSYFKQIGRWCKSFGMKSTGHVLNEDLPVLQIPSQGDIFKVLKELDPVGIDYLFLRIGGIAPKIASSIAHRGGKKSICEAYGASSWGIDLEKKKWIADWLYTQGIDLINPHAFYASIKGFRKYDYPPSHFYQNTFWKYYKIFSIYIGRLRSILSGGKHFADVAVLYPVKTFFAHFAGNHFDGTGKITDQDLRVIFEILQRINCDFDFIDEDDLGSANIKDGKLVLEESFSFLILPSCRVLSQHSIDKIKEFCEQGGTAIFTTILPEEDGKEKISPWWKFVQNPTESFPFEHSYLLEGLTYISGPLHSIIGKVAESFIPEYEIDVQEEQIGKGKSIFIFSKSGLLLNEKTKEIFRKILDGVRMKTDSEDIRHIHKVREGLHIYFLSNISSRKVRAELSFRERGKIERWDLETGEMEEVETIDGKIIHEFPEYGSALFVIKEGEPKEGKERKKEGKKRIYFQDEWRVARESKNIFPLKGSKIDSYMEMDAKILFAGKLLLNGKYLSGRKTRFLDEEMEEVEVRLKKGENKIDVDGIAYLLGDFAVDGKKLVREPEKISGTWTKWYPFYSGTMKYDQSIVLPESKSCRLFMDDVRNIAEVLVNGKDAGTRCWNPYEWDVSKLVKKGENIFTIKVTATPANIFEHPLPSGILGKVWVEVDE